MQRLEPFKCHDNPAPCTANTGIRPSGLNAAHTIPALVHEICERQRCPLFLPLQIEDRGWSNAPEQETRRVILWIAADLTDAPSRLRKCSGHIRGSRGLADAALAVERNFFHKLSSFHGNKKRAARLLEAVLRRFLNLFTLRPPHALQDLPRWRDRDCAAPQVFPQMHSTGRAAALRAGSPPCGEAPTD